MTVKKVLCVGLVTLFASKAAIVQGQNFPDGGFENVGSTWEQKTTSQQAKYWDFRNNYMLSSLNLLHDLGASLGIAPLTLFRETSNVHTRQYAIKVVSDTMAVGNEGIFLPGVAATIEIDIAEQDENFIVVLGSNYAHRPDFLHGFLQYLPVNGDSAAIEIQLTRYNANTNKHTIVGSGKMVFTEPINEWTEFGVPISYRTNETPHKVILIFSSSAKYDFTSFATLMDCNGQRGSTLYIDDVSFIFGLDNVKEMILPEVKMNVSPNPSVDEITIHLDQHTNGTVFIYDNTGKKIGSYAIDGMQKNIAIQDYEVGTYLINIVENDHVVATGRFLKQ